ncbi:MAG: hypothetical protein UU31_C0005G0002 [Candidatus Uhrbacteria bacterium GW2011_GWA2_41_10]|nr:MAG: hypothetical protein UU31_C0005G0002 [Candidatus Uhrbacteria bacterium GW2011_GWA2_41_10]
MFSNNKQEKGGQKMSEVKISEKFLALIKAFAEEAELEESVVQIALLKLVKPSDKGIEKLANLPDASILKGFEGVEGATEADILFAINKVVKPKPAPVASAVETAVPVNPVNPLAGLVTVAKESKKASILPTLPDFASLLDVFRVGGDLVVSPELAIVGAQAALAQNYGIEDLEKSLGALMRTRARSVRRVFGVEQEKLFRKALSKDSDFDAILPSSSPFWTKTEREEFYKNWGFVWKATAAFYDVLAGWRQALRDDHQDLIGALTGDLDDAPDTTPLQAEGARVIETVNEALIGPGALIAGRMAAEAGWRRELLNNSQILTFTNMTKEEILRELHLDVSIADVKVEQAIALFLNGILHATTKATPDVEVKYYKDLFNVGRSIPWSVIGQTVTTVGVRTGSNGHQPAASVDGRKTGGRRQPYGDIDQAGPPNFGAPTNYRG